MKITFHEGTGRDSEAREGASMKKFLLIGLLWTVLAGPGPFAGLAQGPGLDGLALLQAIPVRITRFFDAATAARILEDLSEIALAQWDLEGVQETVTEPATGAEKLARGGEFGRLIREDLLAFDPERDGGMLVEHVELNQDPDFPVFDEDRYRLNVGELEIDLALSRLEARPEKGLDWGIRTIESRTFLVEAGRLRVATLTIVNEVATFTVRFFAPNGRFLEGFLIEFSRGNPEPVAERNL